MNQNLTSDNSFFEYYNIAWQLAVFLVTLNPKIVNELYDTVETAIIVETY